MKRTCSVFFASLMIALGCEAPPDDAAAGDDMENAEQALAGSTADTRSILVPGRLTTTKLVAPSSACFRKLISPPV